MADWRILPTDAAAQVAKPENLALSRRVHAAAVTWVGEAHKLDPAAPTVVISCEVREHTEIDVVANGADTLGGCLAQRGMVVSELRLPLAPSTADIAAALVRVEAAEQVVCVSYNAVLKPEQQALLAALPAEKTWLVAGRLPYDLGLLPSARARLTDFSNRPAALSALADALLPMQ